jgi:hypothetical protein
MAQDSVWQQILDYSNRADPYPLYAELRRTPVVRAEDGSYVVSTYREIVALLHDPRLSSDMRNVPELGADAAAQASEGGSTRAAAQRHPNRPARTRPNPAPADVELRAAPPPRSRRQHDSRHVRDRDERDRRLRRQ